MSKNTLNILVVSASSLSLARKIRDEYPGKTVIYCREADNDIEPVTSFKELTGNLSINRKRLCLSGRWVSAYGVSLLHQEQVHGPGSHLPRQYRQICRIGTIRSYRWGERTDMNWPAYWTPKRLSRHRVTTRDFGHWTPSRNNMAGNRMSTTHKKA